MHLILLSSGTSGGKELAAVLVALRLKLKVIFTLDWGVS